MVLSVAAKAVLKIAAKKRAIAYAHRIKKKASKKKATTKKHRAGRR
tara:strand:+ start:415 stop:552 length:138 start_codon:yes stop_codon:yes gene_type:complete